SSSGTAFTSATISALVRPSGMVRRCRTALPLASSSATPSGVIAASNSYSPAFRRWTSPVTPASSRKSTGCASTPSAARARAMSTAPPRRASTTVRFSGSGPGVVQSRHAQSPKLPAEATSSMRAGTSRAPDRQAIAPTLAHEAEDERGVGTAEAEGVRERVAHRPLLCFVGYEIDIAAGRGVVEVQGRRHDPVAQRQDREDRLDAAGSAQQVPDRGFGRGHRELVGMVAEEPLHRAELDLVAFGRRGAV